MVPLVQRRGAVPFLVLLLVAGAIGGSAPSRATGAISMWVWHFEPVLMQETLPTYRGLLRVIPDDVRVLVAVRSECEAEVFRESLPDPRVEFVTVSERISAWARDRYIPFEFGGRQFVLVPDGQSVAAGRVGDVAVALALPLRVPGLQILQSHLDIEGGDVLVTDEHVIVGAGTILQNVERCQHSAEAAEAEIARIFGRDVVVVGHVDSDLPADHIDMFLAQAGPRHLVMGDPSLTLSFFAARSDLGVVGDAVRDLGNFTRDRQIEAQFLYDRIAGQLGEAGFKISRVPVLHGDQGELLTWTNVVQEERDGKRRVYVPNYGVPYLDRLANSCWKQAGFAVFPVPADGIINQGGAVRCLSNVLRN